MAATPFILFFLVFVIDVLFIINFFFVREVRKLADATDALKKERGSDSQQSTTAEGQSKEQADSRVSRIRADDASATSASSGSSDAMVDSSAATPLPRSDLTTATAGTTATTIDHVAKEILYPILFDTTFKERNEIRCFKWRRKWSSILFTALLLVGSNMVFTPQILLLEWTMAKPLVESSEPDFCAQSSKLDKLNDFHTTLEHMTQRHLAAEQTAYLEQLHTAMAADIELYGVDGYTCPSIGSVPGNQDDYNEQEWHLKQGPFFPGYCGAALEASLQQAQTEQCTKTVCVDFKGPLQAVTWGKRCVDVQVACSLMGDGDNRSSNKNEEALIDYRSTQLDITNQKIQEGTGIEFPHEFSDTAATGQAIASQLITKILHQVDIAGTVYTFYAILAFIFPAPLTMFQPSLWASATRFLLGAQKHQFILLSIATWWLFEYGDVFLKSPTLRLQLNAMLRDPCFIDSDFVALRRDAWYDTCNEMLQHTNTHQAHSTALDHLVRQAEMFVETEECCGGLFPYNAVQAMETTSNAEALRLRDLGFSEELSFLSNYNVNGSVYGLSANYSFVGDTTICTNTSAAEQLIFGFDQDAEVNWWDFWIKTGLIASIFVPVLITNLGLAVHGLADPLSQCAGEYEFPSNRFLQVRVVDGRALRQRFERGLLTVSMKWCFIWFVLVKLCLVNLMMASNIGETLTGADTEASIVQIAFFVVVIGGCIGAFLLGLTILANRRRLVLELSPRQQSPAAEETRLRV